MDRTTARRRWARSPAPYLLLHALDVVSKPLGVFDPEGREIVRNRALDRLVEREEGGGGTAVRTREGGDLGLVDRMREVARAADRGPARIVHRTGLGRFALVGRPLEPGEMLDVRAVVVALEPV